MAWNGSDKEKVEVEGQGQQRRGKIRSSTSTKHFNCKALVAGLVVVIGGGLSVWMMMRGERGETGEMVEIKVSQIAEVQPQIVTNATAVNVVDGEMKARDPNADPPNTYRDDKGVLRKPGGMRVKDPKRKHVKVPRPSWMKEPVFRNAADREIASIISLEPGERVYGSRVKHDSNFERQFVEALTSGDQINEDDSERVKQLKREVYEAKKELAARIKAGENLGDILEEARKEQQILANYRDNILKELNDMTKKNAMTDEEIADYVSAANKMLASKGMRELKEMSFIMRNMRMRKEHNDNTEGNIKE